MAMAPEVTSEPGIDTRMSKVMSKLPFPDLPAKALEITGGVIPTGMAFPVDNNQPLDYETAIDVAKKVADVLKAMEADFDAKFPDSKPSIADLQTLARSTLAKSRLSNLFVKSLSNLQYLMRCAARRRLQSYRKRLPMITKLTKKLNNAYMVSITLKEDVYLITKMREVKKLENRVRHQAIAAEALLKENEAQAKAIGKLLTTYLTVPKQLQEILRCAELVMEKTCKDYSRSAK